MEQNEFENFKVLTYSAFCDPNLIMVHENSDYSNIYLSKKDFLKITYEGHAKDKVYKFFPGHVNDYGLHKLGDRTVMVFSTEYKYDFLKVFKIFHEHFVNILEAKVLHYSNLIELWNSQLLHLSDGKPTKAIDTMHQLQSTDTSDN